MRVRPLTFEHLSVLVTHLYRCPGGMRREKFGFYLVGSLFPYYHRASTFLRPTLAAVWQPGPSGNNSVAYS